jgi:phage tail sheath protein FI
MPTASKTPGVYVVETPIAAAQPAQVRTDIPGFIGYTESAADPGSHKPLGGTPVSIASMAEYRACFGGPPTPNFVVVPSEASNPAFVADLTDPNGGVASRGFDLTLAARADGPDRFCLYWQMELYFANGGGACWVVSVGDYGGTIASAALLAGIQAMGEIADPTMLVVPEACQLGPDDYAGVIGAMVAQAGALRDRIAILDLPGCHGATDLTRLTAAQEQLWVALAPQADFLSYAAAYGPALATTIVQPRDVRFMALAGADNSVLNAILTAQAVALFDGRNLATLQGAIAAAFPVAGATANTAALSGEASPYPGPAAPGAEELALWQQRLDDLLTNALPIYVEIDQLATDYLNVQPSSGLVAGVWVRSDAAAGVWSAPANVALAGVASPICPVNDTQQGDFNTPVNGMAVNLLRQFAGRGTLVWGARTLDGNSQDFRYVQVRRTILYAEQSIKQMLATQVFATNDAATWAKVVADASQFLNGLWAAGGLTGSSAGDAFEMQCGLGTTMTGQDVLDGMLIASVRLSLLHPSDFIELTFRQAMQGS